MQTYPGGIMSGLDYYMSDAGLVVCETTIAQTRFEHGVPLADRIRRALQYGESIDDAVKILRRDNNGLYTNEWLLADTRANEVAMFELGTRQSRLWRSSRNEWYGGTAGFYWGCNNPKDLEVRLETIPSTTGRPANVVFHPSDRDRTWLRLFDRRDKGIDGDFGFRAFTTPPLAASHSLDAKFTTSAMVKELATWARFGPPMGSIWEPTESERSRFPGMHPLIANDWTILRVDPPGGSPTEPVKKAVDLARVSPARESGHEPEHGRDHTPAWVGTILPRSDADTWLAAAFADYEPIVAAESAAKAKAHDGRLGARDRERIAVSLFAPTSRYLAAVARRGGKDLPLREIRADLRSDEWYDIAAGKGVLVLAELRAAMGDDPFTRFMDAFGRAHAGRSVDATEFFQAAAQAHGKPLTDRADDWLGPDALNHLGADVSARHSSGRFWSVDSFERELRQGRDRLRHFGRGRRPARGSRGPPAQARQPLGQRHRAGQVRRRGHRTPAQRRPHPAGRSTGDQPLECPVSRGPAGAVRRVVREGRRRDIRPPAHGHRGRGAQPDGCGPVRRHLRGPERGGDVGLRTPLPRSWPGDRRGDRRGSRRPGATSCDHISVKFS